MYENICKKACRLESSKKIPTKPEKDKYYL
jgi:hypothetical protein